MTPEGKLKLKAYAKKVAEDHVMLAIDEVYELGQIYVDDSANPLDNTILSGLELLKKLIVDAADQIDPTDNV